MIHKIRAAAAAVLVPVAAGLCVPLAQAGQPADSRAGSQGVGPGSAGGTATPLPAIGMTSAELEFMMAATHANLAMIEAGHDAMQRAENPAVKELAKRMLEHHGAQHARLQQLAGRSGVVLPGTPTQQQAEVINGLEGMRGAAYERDFVSRIGIEAHREAITLYNKQAPSKAANPALFEYAAAALGPMQRHLAAAESLQARMAQQGDTRSSGAGPAGSAQGQK